MSALRRSAVGAARLALRDGASRGAIMTPRAIGATVGAETRAVERYVDAMICFFCLRLAMIRGVCLNAASGWAARRVDRSIAVLDRSNRSGCGRVVEPVSERFLFLLTALVADARTRRRTCFR